MQHPEFGEVHDHISQLFTTFAQEWDQLWLSGKLAPETLAGINPDYQNFSPLPEVHPLLSASPSALEGFPHQGKIAVAVLGPSSSGKDTILHNLDFPFAWIRTTTTRSLRSGDPMESAYVFSSEALFNADQAADKFIETLPQTAGMYGTSVAQTLSALESDSPIIVWRGEIKGLPKIKDWFKTNQPHVPFRTVFILPHMTMYELVAMIIRKRGMTEAFKGRIAKAFKEVRTAGSLADFLLSNPPQAEGPVAATSALRSLFSYFTKA